MVTLDHLPQLACPLCQSTDFNREQQTTEGRWRATKQIMTLMICARCRYVITFYEKRSLNRRGSGSFKS